MPGMVGIPDLGGGMCLDPFIVVDQILLPISLGLDSIAL